MPELCTDHFGIRIGEFRNGARYGKQTAYCWVETETQKEFIRNYIYKDDKLISMKEITDHPKMAFYGKDGKHLTAVADNF